MLGVDEIDAEDDDLVQKVLLLVKELLAPLVEIGVFFV